MTITVSNKTSGSADANGPYTTASTTPASNTLQLLTVHGRCADATCPQPTVSGCGLTWVLISDILYDTVSPPRTKRLSLFRAMGASPSTGALTITYAGQTLTTAQWILDEATGVNTSGANGAGAIVQAAPNKDETFSQTVLTVTLGAFADAANGTYGCFVNDAPITPSVGAGFTLADTDTGSLLGAGTEWKTTNDTTVDMTDGDAASAAMGGIAIEIAVAAAGGGQAPRTMHRKMMAA